VRLDIRYDIARVVYRLRDNEQRLRSAAQFEGPSSAVDKLHSDKASKSHSDSDKKADAATSDDSRRRKKDRRLISVNDSRSDGADVNGITIRGSSDVSAPMTRQLGATVKEPVRTSGEAQYRDAYQSFMLDVGFSRKIVVAVQCADATQANIGAYTLVVHRPGCSPERPYFDPSKQFCVNFCPSGMYRNEETHRCSKCNTNCKVCDSLLHCQMCKPDTADYSYMVQPDGRCQATVNHLFKKYRWWCIGLAILLGFLVLIGCIGICQLLGTCGHGIEKQRKVHSYESDSGDEEGPPYGARRRLAQY